MANSTTRQAPSKPAKPHPDFPLFPHASGRWAKKIRGQFKYFGKVADDPKGEAALTLWNEQKDDLLAGRTPRPKADGFTLRELLDRFVVSKRHLLDTCEISPKHFADIYATCKRIRDSFGLHRLVDDLRTDDFDRLRRNIAKTWGPIRLGNEVQRVRSVFKFGADSGFCPVPIFGPTFKKPSRKVLRLNRARNGQRMFEAAELQKIIAAATQPMKAMILLGINCGYGNQDVATLPIKALDLKAGWATFPRPKTGINRRCPLWPETIAAVQAALAERPRHKSPADAPIAFMTVQGHPWTKTAVSEPDPDTGKIVLTNNTPVTQEFNKLLKRLHLKRPGLGFYALRHTFETIGGDRCDQVAVNDLMGHADDSMAATYRERINDARRKAVTDHVHKWLHSTEQSK